MRTANAAAEPPRPGFIPYTFTLTVPVTCTTQHVNTCPQMYTLTLPTAAPAPTVITWSTA